MIELVDTFPDINVQPAEYKRLLGFPRDYVMTGRVRELAEWARNWYTRHGRPWVYARHAESLATGNGSVKIDGVAFSSPRLQKTLRDAQAHNVILAAVGAGAELESEAQQLWHEQKPDEYFFLEVYGSAVVEHLTTITGARLCGWAERNQMAVLPHYSPGYPEWDIGEQPRLLELTRRTHKQAIPCKIDVLDSGMLRPKKSLLAVFGLTRHTQHVARLTDLVPCENCAMQSCQYRRVPYIRAPEHSQPVVSQNFGSPADRAVAASAPLRQAAEYTINIKALRRWAAERLSLEVCPDGKIDAHFRYDGTTCTNMGRSLTFFYRVTLSSRDEGYTILDQFCGPAPGDTGYTYMCRYMNNAEHLMVAIDREKPLLGKPLDDVLAWKAPDDPAGCYCEPSSRKHKWSLVLQTIHFALAQQEISR